MEQTPKRWPLIALALLAAAAAGVWILQSRTSLPPQTPGAEVVNAPPLEPLLPPVKDSDATLKSLLAAVSSRADVRSWLESGDLLQRAVVVIVNLSDGDSPRQQVPFLAPHDPFRVTTKGGKTVIDRASYGRYYFLGDVANSIDAPALARALSALHPLLVTAYRQFGNNGRTFDQQLARALSRIAFAPVLDDDLEVETQPTVAHRPHLWRYTDPKLEGLGTIEKQLLRTGPRNTRFLQAKVRAVAEELNIPLTPPK